MVVIIAILAAILMPALVRAREQARRKVCMNNLRQAYIYHAMFADDNEGSVPIGHQSNCKQRNYFFFHTPPGNGGYLQHGLLLKGEYLAGDGREFLCPTQTSPLVTYNSSGNPWPPRERGNTRAMFSTRPIANWSDANLQDGGDDLDFIVPDTWAKLDDDVDGRSSWVIFSDISYKMSMVIDTGHRDGLNVAQNDGAVK